MQDVTLLAAFAAGLFSFLSPCVLPLVPAFLTFLAGKSVEEARSSQGGAAPGIFLASVFFVLGFSAVFSVLGVLLQSALSGVAYGTRSWLGYIGGAIIILFGLSMMGIIKVSALQAEHKIRVEKKGSEQLSSFIFGAAFAIGWTPCVGAILGSVLALAATQPQIAFPLMLSYSLGLGVPFLLAGLFASKAFSAVKAISPYLPALNFVFGLFIVALGILVFTNTLSFVANLVSFPLLVVPW